MDEGGVQSHTTKMRLLLLTPLLVVGCGSLPKDPEGTLDRVREQGSIRVGLVLGSEALDGVAWQRVLTRVAAATRAKPSFRAGQLEPLLVELEAGNLDLVVGGRFAADTPWKKRVNLGVPLVKAKTAGRSMAGRIAERNGENAWISLIDRETRTALGS
jgi:hypothetical protein